VPPVSDVPPTRLALTRRGWTLGGAAAGLLVGSRLLGAPELAVLGLSAAGLLAAAVAWAAAAALHLDVVRRVRPLRCQVGDDAYAELDVRNAGRRGTSFVALAEPFGTDGRAARSVLAPLAPGEHARTAYRIPTTRRGRVSLGPLQGATGDPMGLARRAVVVAPATSVVVRPRVHAIAPPRGGGGRPDAGAAEVTRRQVAPEALGEFLALRPYELGDDLRRVHWRSTARAGELVVRQDEGWSTGTTVVVLDTRDGAEPGAFESAVEVVASIVTALARAGRPVEVETTAGAGLAGSSGVLGAVLDRLAEVAPDAPGAPSGLGAVRRRDRPPELLVAVLTRLDLSTARSLAIMARGCGVLVVVTGTPPAGTPVPADPTLPVITLDGTPFPAAWAAGLARWSAAPLPSRSRSPR
jgi:uncharacterized protein (DUF58 family)